MEIGETLEVDGGAKFRDWLRRNHKKKKEIWIIYYRKSSGKKSITYEQALDEALCFGWIDSTSKGIDGEKYSQRYTPRRRGSPISEMNKERVRRLIESGMMTDAGLDALTEEEVDDIRNPSPLRVTPDILKELKRDEEVWNNFQNFPDYYKRIRIAYIENYRHRDKSMFKKALDNFIKNTKKNKRYGMMR